jgi:peptidoglycan/xylan/chitin deacetylase (PgdA/CDA1 family)
MIQDFHCARFSHEFAGASNIWRVVLLLFFFSALPACSTSFGNPAKPATTSSGTASETPLASPIPAAATGSPPTFPRSTTTPIPSNTPTGTPTYSPSPTPYLTPPTIGQFVAIPILMYHHLEGLASNATLIQRTWTVSPSSFEEQLDYLAAHGYHTISFGQLDAFFEQGQPLPIHPVVLTFDDGWSDDYEVAFPALRERGMVGTFFVPTAYAGAPGGKLLSWDQIDEMDAAGMEFGGHTIDHADLKRVSKEEALRQLLVSKSKMEERLGHATIVFAYPFGVYDAGVISQVQEVGYRVAVGLCCGYKLRAEILLTLPRIRISYDDKLPDFVKKLPPDSP